jgi:hypothetical protein
MQEQQLHARIAVLQQQAQSAVAAASKTQREVRRSRDTGSQLCCTMSASSLFVRLSTAAGGCMETAPPFLASPFTFSPILIVSCNAVRFEASCVGLCTCA